MVRVLYKHIRVGLISRRNANWNQSAIIIFMKRHIGIIDTDKLLIKVDVKIERECVCVTQGSQLSSLWCKSIENDRVEPRKDKYGNGLQIYMNVQTQLYIIT